MPETPCFCSNSLAERFSAGFLSEVVSPRYGCANAKVAPIATKTNAPGIHQISPSQRARNITTRRAMQSDDERAAELEPVAERPLEVARLGQVVPPRPPDIEQRERKLDEPDDPEAEHAEQHPGADRPGGRLPGEPRPAPRVDPQRREERDLPEHPGEEEEPLDVDGLANECLAEDGVDVDAGEMQAGGNRGAEEERCAHEPDGDRDSGDDDAGGAVQAGSIPTGSSIGSTSCSSRSRSRTAGAEYG